MSNSDNDNKNDAQTRLNVLREIIRDGSANTQDDLCKALRGRKFDVTQSTISRDLRRIGAMKTTNKEGEIIYILHDDHQTVLPMAVSHSLGGLLVGVDANESMVVLQTSPGSASLVARHLDSMRESIGILGTIAGDDTIFVAPAKGQKIANLIKRIKDEF